MISRPTCFTGIVFLTCLGAFQGALMAATRVEIVIDEPFENRQVAWPVTTGIPFPRGGLIKVDECRLVDDQGVERPLQARVAATWDRQRSSIRWLTIDFIAQPGRRYALEFGPDIRRAKFNSSIMIEQGEPLRISTGAAQVEFHKQGPFGLGSVRVDLNGDGKFDPSEVVASGAAEGEHYYIDQNGQRFSCARDGDERQVVLEVAGPVRACIRVDGYYTGPNGRRIVKYRTRYHLFAGLPLMKVIDEFKIVGSTRQTRFRDIAFALDLPGGVEDRVVAVDSSGEPGNQVQRVEWKPDTASISSFQSLYRHFGNPGYEAAVVEIDSSGENRLRQQDRMGEWMQVSGRRGTVTGSLRWFWQQFPKEWETSPSQLVLHLWSPRSGELDFGRKGLLKTFGEQGRYWLIDRGGDPKKLNPVSRQMLFAGNSALQRGEVDGQGTNKHHEFYLHFGDQHQTAKGREYGRLAARQPLALASGAWNCSTDVFGPLAARPNNSKYEQIVDRVFDLKRYAQDSFGAYGWWVFGSGPHYSYHWDAQTKRHYANAMRFEYHTYQKETQLWWCYLRSGERKFYDWAFPSENHWVDIAVSHVPLMYRCAWKGGRPQEQTLHFRPGEWAIDSPMFYLRQRDSAEAWLRGGAQFWASYHRTLETTSLAYYLTGDERFNDVIEFWRQYWSDLAGKTSASKDLKPWHREQPWFRATAAGEPTKSWAEMIRDYAPFTSGLRHQMTQFFNLATLYEHTWDPKIGQVLSECAEAYLDPQHPIGVWRTQENSPPNSAAAPKLAHFWVPALWKYHRVTNDPRMPEIFRKYFDACLGTDPFREDVGRYSNVHIGYAYYYTHDPRHLRAAILELERLAPFGLPLQHPKELGSRIYNPYVPIQSLTAVPRLTWALAAARRDGTPVPPPVRMKTMQRTAIALTKTVDRPLQATLWGFDPTVEVLSPDGAQIKPHVTKLRRYASDIQPFDRTTPELEVFRYEVEIPAQAAAGPYVLVPGLECVVLSTTSPAIQVNAARPVALGPGESVVLEIGQAKQAFQLVSASASSLRMTTSGGKVISVRPKKGRRLLVEAGQDDSIRITNSGRAKVWFQVEGLPVERCWATIDAVRPKIIPDKRQSLAAVPPRPAVQLKREFVEGRFGQAVPITARRRLHLPDHVVKDGRIQELFTRQRGSLEFWVKSLWDTRMSGPKRVEFLTNGVISSWNAGPLPVNEWAHVAIEWRPLKRDPSRQAVHIYINGLDRQSYRSIWWEGYGRKALTFPANRKWLQEFVVATTGGAPFLIDELRISSQLRYTDESVELGHRQLHNPSRFQPPETRFRPDEHTLLLMRFDGHLQAELPAVQGRFETVAGPDE